MRAYVCLVGMLLAAAACGDSSIEVSCTMNGLGSGSCSFTNTGKAEGSMCGVIEVVRKGGGQSVAKSSTFCSGKVEAASTTNVEFAIPDVRAGCDPSMALGHDKAWTDVCEFGFVPKK